MKACFIETQTQNVPKIFMHLWRWKHLIGQIHQPQWQYKIKLRANVDSNIYEIGEKKCLFSQLRSNKV